MAGFYTDSRGGRLRRQGVELITAEPLSSRFCQPDDRVDRVFHPSGLPIRHLDFRRALARKNLDDLVGVDESNARLFSGLVCLAKFDERHITSTLCREADRR
jgi:hypothetical protein